MSGELRMGLIIALGFLVIGALALFGPFVLYIILDKLGGFSGSSDEPRGGSDDDDEGRVRLNDYLSEDQIEYLRSALRYEMGQQETISEMSGMRADLSGYRRALDHLDNINPSIDDDDRYVAAMALERHADDPRAVGVLEVLAPSLLAYGSALQAEAGDADAGEGDVEQRFWSLYEESLRLKDQGHLASALAKREEGLALCEEVADQDDLYHGLKGMAYHNIAILAMYHLGDGELAASAARKSLQEGAAFSEYSEACRDRIAFGAHLESLQTAAITAASYEEALGYLKDARELHGDDSSMFDATAEAQSNGIRWGEYQFSRSQLHFSRESAEKDKGDYAPGMAYLQLLIDRSEDPAYELSYEEFEDVLDTYGFITVQYMLTKSMASQMSPEDFSRELAFLADAPLQRIADFLPDCQPSDRPTFDFIVNNGFRMLPGVAERDSFAPFR